MSSALHWRRFAAAAPIATFNFVAASITAEPPITVERELNEPKPSRTCVVEP